MEAYSTEISTKMKGLIPAGTEVMSTDVRIENITWVVEFDTPPNCEMVAVKSKDGSRMCRLNRKTLKSA